MPPSRTHHPHDPFTDAPLRPTTSNATSLRTQSSQHSLRSNGSAHAHAARARPPRDLFAPGLSRRPTSRATPRGEGDVLVDSDSSASERVGAVRQRRGGGVAPRLGSPEHITHRARAVKSRSAVVGGEDEQEFVNRQPDGGFVLGVTGFGDTLALPQGLGGKSEEELETEEIDAQYLGIARRYFSESTVGKSGKKQEEEMDMLKLPMTLRLREQVMRQLEDERWRFENMSR